MEKLTILTLEEGSRLEWQESLTGYFRESGDYTVYLMPPCIMLPEERDIREWFDIGDGIFTLSGPIGRVSSFWCMRIDDSRLPQGKFRTDMILADRDNGKALSDKLHVVTGFKRFSHTHFHEFGQCKASA